MAAPPFVIRDPRSPSPSRSNALVFPAYPRTPMYSRDRYMPMSNKGGEVGPFSYGGATVTVPSPTRVSFKLR